MNGGMQGAGRQMLAAAAIAALAASGAYAQNVRPAADRTEALSKLRTQDERVVAVGDRLARAAAAAGWCDAAPSIGWTLGEVGQYPKALRLQVRQVWNLPAGTSLFVAAVAPGSTAARLGIRPGTGITRINGMAPMRNPYDMPSRHALANSERVIDAALEQGPITVETVSRDGERKEYSVGGAPACRSRFETSADDTPQAYADGNIVQVTAAMGEFTGTNDSELAAVIAHELAHNILRHIPRTEEAGTPEDYRRYLGRYARMSRKMEEEADRLSVWLLALAGYDPNAPIAFWERFGPDHDSAHPFGRTHDRWRDRVTAIRDELALMAREKARNPRARPALLDRAHEPAPGAEPPADADADAAAPATPAVPPSAPSAARSAAPSPTPPPGEG